MRKRCLNINSLLASGFCSHAAISLWFLLGVWTKIRSLASGFCSHAAISLWFLLFFFRFFLDQFFFVNFSRPSFLFEQISLSLLVLLSTCGILALIFRFFYLIFFRNGFPNSLIVRSRSSFCLVNENSLNCTSGLVLLCFFISSSRFLLRPYDVTTTSNLLFVHSFMQFQLNCVRDVIFYS